MITITITLEKLVFKTNYRLMQVKSTCIVECSILQYFRPSLSYHLFCLFYTGFTVHVFRFLHNSITFLIHLQSNLVSQPFEEDAWGELPYVPGTLLMTGSKINKLENDINNFSYRFHLNRLLLTDSVI